MKNDKKQEELIILKKSLKIEEKFNNFNDKETEENPYQNCKEEIDSPNWNFLN